MCKYIKILKNITPNLPEAPSLSKFKSTKEGFTEYIFKTGTSLSFSLYNDKDISIAKTFISENTFFENHVHIGYEIIIVLKGKLEFEIGDNKIILQNHNKIDIVQNQVHSARALTDVWLIALTVPKDDGFPE